jgi:hypothetical protein
MTLKMRECIFAPASSIRFLWALFAIFCFVSEYGHCQAWVSRSSGTTVDLNGVAYGNNIFVAVGGSLTIQSSTDGIIWSNRVSRVGAKELSGVAYGNNRFIALGGGNIATSSDGVTWTTSTLQPTETFVTIVYGAAAFMALDVFGGVATSPDGAVWTPQSTGSSGILGGIVYARNQFVAVGTPGIVLTSPDGVKWAAQNSGTSWELYSVTYGNNQYVAIGQYGTIITSPDGTNWTTRGSDVTYTHNGVTYGNNEFVAVGVDQLSDASILTSPDGITWTNVDAPSKYELSAVAYGANRFVAVGLHGTILQAGTPSTQPATLGPVSLLTSGAVQGTVIGVAGQTYSIQFSSNLKDWLNLTNITLANGTGSFTDPSAASGNQRFYRALGK